MLSDALFTRISDTTLLKKIKKTQSIGAEYCLPRDYTCSWRSGGKASAKHRVDITIRVEAGGLAQCCQLVRILSVWS